MEKFNLSSNNFDENILNSFKDLKYDKDFTDVTLVCEENKQVKAHKVVISSCSEFFKSILIQNPHQHPLVYLHGVSFVQLQAILNFVYLGQTQVEQQELQSFLQAAKTLKIKGLSDENYTNMDRDSSVPNGNTDSNSTEDEETIDTETVNDIDTDYKFQTDNEKIEMIFEQTLDSGADFKTLKVSLMGDGKFPCAQCGNTFISLRTLKRHVQYAHEGVRYPCDGCDYKATTGSHLKRHWKNAHVEDTV